MHNESNVFHKEDYASRLKFPLTAPKRAVEPASFVNTNAFSPAEIEHIKRLNHNFSDVFGLEYGSREVVKRGPVRNLSPKLEWVQVDSIKNRKDIGENHQQTKTVFVSHIIQLVKCRSRVMDQRSCLDTHNEYEKPLQKPQKLEVTKNAI